MHNNGEIKMVQHYFFLPKADRLKPRLIKSLQAFLTAIKVPFGAEGFAKKYLSQQKSCRKIKI